MGFYQIKGSFEEEEQKLPPCVLEGPEIIGSQINLDHMLIKAFQVQVEWNNGHALTMQAQAVFKKDMLGAATV